MLPLSVRKSALMDLHTALKNKEQAIFEALRDDLNRHPFESYITEIAPIKNEIDLALKNLKSWNEERPVNTPIAFLPGASSLRPSPKGVVLIMAPWNYPFQLSLVPLISAIAAGNCALVKPSEMAPHSAKLIALIMEEALDKRCFRAVLGDSETSKSLCQLPYDHIFYTGNGTIGAQVMSRAAQHLTPITLELGGKSPCIVDRSADLSMAVKRIMWGKCLNAGQTCVAPDHVLIEKELMADFISLARSYIRGAYEEDILGSPSYGRIINEHHFYRLMSLMEDGTIALGGRHDLTRRFIEPTILTDVDKGMRVMREEIFGPILPLVAINNMDEAIESIQDRPDPLAIYLFCRDKILINRVFEHTLSGSLTINDCISQAGISQLPFGGVGQSGFGRYHGQYGFETMSHMRAIYKRSNVLDNPVKYPPYSESKLRIAKMLL